MLLFRLTIANVKMIVRNRQALFWALAFPVVMLGIFGLVGGFRGSTVTIGVVDYAGDALSNRLIGSLSDMPDFEVEIRDDEEAARKEVRDGDLGYLLVIPAGLESMAQSDPPVSLTLVHDEGLLGGSVVVAIERFLDQMNLDLAGASARLRLQPEGIALSEGLSFMEFMLPGLALWGIMSNSIIGLAASMATYREKKILRRIKASPLKPRTFFAAQVLAYLAMSLVQATVILGLGAIVFRVPIGGNFLIIGVLILVCNVVFLNLGFIVGAYSKTVAAASGFGNVIVLPLAMFSGVFFPPEMLPGFLTEVMRFLPLAPMVDILRGITLGAKTVLDFPFQIGLIAAWIGVTALAAMKVFKLE